MVALSQEWGRSVRLLRDCRLVEKSGVRQAIGILRSLCQIFARIGLQSQRRVSFIRHAGSGSLILPALPHLTQIHTAIRLTILGTVGLHVCLDGFRRA
jgi:hypothetical protein